ncbi:MAG TPA: XRE family transcriptional regulator [Candidatus Omnitrophota bacterium]|nr:XRE family transcriptional regulator [Candidatus Omnitrophota bacterium]
MYIGKRMQELRKARDMTLSELSENSGVQIATLSRMENNKMTGTLESHMNIAKALGVDVTQLYSDIIRVESKVDIQKTPSSSDVFVHSDKSSYEMLTTKVLSKKMMPILLKLEPGGQTAPEENKLGTEKFIYTLEGKVEVTIGKDSYSLSKGNTLYFDASLKHFFVNEGKSTAKLVCVITPPAL